MSVPSKTFGMLFGALVLVSGCGSEIDMAPVTGRVVMKGKPVRDVFVVFHPQPKNGSVEAPTRPAMGQVDDEGKYALSTKVAGDGAVVGTHRVSIVAVDRDARPPGSVPTEFEVEVKPEPNTVDLELTPSS